MVAYRSDVAQLVFLSRQDLPQNAAHDLPRPSLGQIRYNEDGLGSRERPNRLAHLQYQVLLRLVRAVVAVLQRDERIDRLASELVIHADHGCLGYGIWVQR